MENTNSKIITLSFALAGLIVGMTSHMLLKAFAGAFGVVARYSDSDIVRHGFPVSVGLILFFVLQFHPRIKAWAEEVVIEVRKVVWPTRKDTTVSTVFVVVMVLISSVIITVFDFTSGYIFNILTR